MLDEASADSIKPLASIATVTSSVLESPVLPADFRRMMKGQLSVARFGDFRFGASLQTDNPKLQAQVAVSIREALVDNNVPNADDYLTPPVMPGIDGLVQSGTLTREQGDSIRSRTHSIATLLTLLDDSDFTLENLKEINNNSQGIREVLLTLAQEPHSMYANYDISEIERLSVPQFKALLRKVLALNISGYVDPNERINYPELHTMFRDENTALLEGTLTTEENRYLQIDDSSTAFMRAAGRELSTGTVIMDMKRTESRGPVDDIMNMLAIAREPVNLSQLFEWMGIKTDTLDPQVRAAFTSLLDRYKSGVDKEGNNLYSKPDYTAVTANIPASMKRGKK